MKGNDIPKWIKEIDHLIDEMEVSNEDLKYGLSSRDLAVLLQKAGLESTQLIHSDKFIKSSQLRTKLRYWDYMIDVCLERPVLFIVGRGNDGPYISDAKDELSGAEILQLYNVLNLTPEEILGLHNRGEFESVGPLLILRTLFAAASSVSRLLAHLTCELHVGTAHARSGIVALVNELGEPAAILEGLQLQVKPDGDWFSPVLAGILIKHFRQTHSLTQEALAQRSGLSKGTMFYIESKYYWGIESRKGYWDKITAKASTIADALNIDVSLILNAELGATELKRLGIAMTSEIDSTKF